MVQERNIRIFYKKARLHTLNCRMIFGGLKEGLSLERIRKARLTAKDKT